MSNLLKSYLFAIGLVMLQLGFQCVKFIRWPWNLTALIRIMGPLILFRYFDPVVAMIILDGILDSIEPTISRNNLDYHTRDKYLDLWGWFISIIALWTVIKLPILIKYRTILTLLFLTRSIGTLMFLKSSNRKWLAIFPNLYSTLFIVIPLLNSLQLTSWKFKSLLIPIIFIKIIVEYIHHGSSIKDKLIPFRKYVKYFCPAKQTMYRETGTFPIDKKMTTMKASLFR